MARHEDGDHPSSKEPAASVQVFQTFARRSASRVDRRPLLASAARAPAVSAAAFPEAKSASRTRRLYYCS